ncbi:MAG: ferritin-like domain-containing protein, partial [Myxococcales bacterium]|nr:ferritin-like domain-containing protein [Myxococcales bacterium]
MAAPSTQWLHPRRPAAQFPPYAFGDPSLVDQAEARTSTLARIYHKSQEQAWDGRAVLDELIAKHGGIHFPDDKKAAFAQVAAVLLWGELAAWSISADLALKLDDTPAKMAASSQVFDEARHFYVLRDYLWRAGVPIQKLGGFSRALLVELLETDNLLYKVVGMQLMVENTAVVLFKMIGEARLEPVLSDLLYYFERDEARHVGLGVLTLPSVLAGLSNREARALWWFQTRIQLTMLAGGMTLRESFATLGVDQAEMERHAFRLHDDVLRRMRAHHGADRGADGAAVKGLFEVSKGGQHALNGFLFPRGTPTAAHRLALRAVVGAAA